MVRKINKRSVYYIKSFVNSVGLSDAGIALFTYLQHYHCAGSLCHKKRTK